MSRVRADPDPLGVDVRRLVGRTLDGDRSSFTDLVRRFDPGVRMLVSGMVRGRDAVDDVMQEVYVKAYRSLGSYQPDKSFKAWLHRIAYTTTIDEIRRAKQAVSLDAYEEHDHPSSGAPRVDDRVMRRMDVYKALEALTDSQRAVAVLVDGHGYDYAEAGRILGMKSGTVGFHLNKARTLLRASLADSAAMDGAR